ncbi:hypothetical protein, partial [Staphylococcus aureus]|uniref:hypothetical protein n=1 Tax=Staphylococcus aureus TaxID=1280 RepID=UPI0019552F02
MTAFYYTLHFSFRQIQTFSLRQAIFLCVCFYFDVLDIKKRDLRSQLAWQRSTLAERKFDYHRR